MSEENDPKLNGSPVNGQARPEPFRRPVTWGRPPETVFRAGPLPRGGTLAPLPEPPKAAPARPSGILSGSMIPRAAPAPARPASAPAAPAPIATAPAPQAPVTPAATLVEPDLTVRPLPEPEPAPAPIVAPVAAPPVAPRIDTLPDAVVVGPPRALEAASARGTSSGRLPLYAGGAAAALAAVAVGGWFLTRSPAGAPATSVPPAPALAAPTVPLDAAPVEPAPVETATPAQPEPAEVVPAPATTTRAAPPPATTSAPVRAAPAPSQAQAPAQPTPSPVVAPPPVIVTQPLPEPEPVTPPPTAAERPSADPDAPITTRPQPLD